MTKDDSALNFSGLTHDHTILECHRQEDSYQSGEESCSTIAILRRHPMYDCLMLVKKYRACLEGYSLEFPIEGVQVRNNLTAQGESRSASRKNSVITQQSPPETTATTTVRAPAAVVKECGRRRLASRFFDGDDPMYQSMCISCRSIGSRVQSETNIAKNGAGEAATDLQGSGANTSLQPQTATQPNAKISASLTLPFAQQFDDKGDLCELVHVPINGLLDRLKNYTKSGVAVDSRVYAFAMGLKTSERILTTSSMKELQETPI